MSTPFEELIVFSLLLLGVVGVYYALKLHYIFAFGLVQNTSISYEKKQKIEKIKYYVFTFLKVLLVVGLFAMFIFSMIILSEDESLKDTVIQWWNLVPEGFFLQALWTLVRIAVLITIMKYILKIIYRFLDKQETKLLVKKCYNSNNVKKVYLRVYNTIKYTVVLGVVYRIVHFFPFLEELSYVFLIALILFFISALLFTLREVLIMYKTRK